MGHRGRCGVLEVPVQGGEDRESIAFECLLGEAFAQSLLDPVHVVGGRWQRTVFAMDAKRRRSRVGVGSRVDPSAGQQQVENLVAARLPVPVRGRSRRTTRPLL